MFRGSQIMAFAVQRKIVYGIRNFDLHGGREKEMKNATEMLISLERITYERYSR